MIRLLVILPFLASAADAHSWYSGSKSPEGLSCCSTRDCQPISLSSVSCDPEGCTITLAPGEHIMAPDGGVFRYFGEPMMSPDLGHHACIWWPGGEQSRTPEGFDGVSRCLWVGGGA